MDAISTADSCSKWYPPPSKRPFLVVLWCSPAHTGQQHLAVGGHRGLAARGVVGQDGHHVAADRTELVAVVDPVRKILSNHDVRSAYQTTSILLPLPVDPLLPLSNIGGPRALDEREHGPNVGVAEHILVGGHVGFVTRHQLGGAVLGHFE
jgi:hypothetical protein